MAKRLIERMSSLIIDKECLQCLIQLVEYKVKQKLTHQQRKLMSNKKKKKKKPTTATKGKGRRGRKAAAAADNSSSSEDDENDDANGESDASDVEDDLEANSEENDDLSLLDDENDDSKVETTDGNNDRELLKHIDDDGEKGLKLIQYIMNIHGNYGFANVSNYQRLFTFVNSSKEHIVSASLKLLGSHFSADIVRANSGEVEMETYEKVNASYLGKLKYFCKNGKPKQAKHAVHLIFNNFEKTKSQKILFDLYKVRPFLSYFIFVERILFLGGGGIFVWGKILKYWVRGDHFKIGKVNCIVLKTEEKAFLAKKNGFQQEKFYF